MPGYQAPSGARIQSPDFSGTTVITIQSAAAAGTKGAWGQVIASTNFDSDWLLCTLGWGTAGRTSLVDIGVGAAAAELVLVSDLPYEQRTLVASNPFTYMLPLKIKAGSRIAARGNISGATTKQFGIWCQPIAGSYMMPFDTQRIVSFGPAATPAMATVDPGAVANTKGAWTVLSGATAPDIKAIMLVVSKAAPTGASIDWRIDLGIGGAGSEVVILPDYYATIDTNMVTVVPTVSPIIPINIPEGSRLVARAQCANTTATTRNVNVSVIGLS